MQQACSVWGLAVALGRRGCGGETMKGEPRCSIGGRLMLVHGSVGAGLRPRSDLHVCFAIGLWWICHKFFTPSPDPRESLELNLGTVVPDHGGPHP